VPPSKSVTLTEAELRLMDVLWLKGPSTVQQVMDALPRLGLVGGDLLETACGDDTPPRAVAAVEVVDLEAGICKPTKGASFADCPFFDKSDPLDLHGAFKEVEAPAFRANKNPG